MKSIHLLLGATILALVTAGCGSTLVQPMAAGTEPKQLEIDGLVFSVHPMTDKTELKQTFKVNLLANGVLPVLVKVENRNPSNSFTIDREKVQVLAEQSGVTNSAGSGDVAKDLYTTHVSKGDQIAKVPGVVLFGPIPAVTIPLLIFAPAPGDVIDRKAEFNLTGKEFYTRTLDPGRRAEGFIYFRLPTEHTLTGPCHVIAEARNVTTGQITPFDVPVKLDFKQP